MQSWIRENPRAAAGVFLLLAAAPLLGAYGFEYLGGLAPCKLCLYQRAPYWAVITLLIVVLVAGAVGRGLGRRVVAAALALSGAVFLIGTGLAVFHVGVEQGWWTGLEGCSAGSTIGLSLEELRAQIMNAPVVFCTDIPWSIAGVSIAGLNVIASLALAGLAIAMARMIVRERPA